MLYFPSYYTYKWPYTSDLPRKLSRTLASNIVSSVTLIPLQLHEYLFKAFLDSWTSVLVAAILPFWLTE